MNTRMDGWTMDGQMDARNPASWLNTGSKQCSFGKKQGWCTAPNTLQNVFRPFSCPGPLPHSYNEMMCFISWHGTLSNQITSLLCSRPSVAPQCL